MEDGRQAEEMETQECGSQQEEAAWIWKQAERDAVAQSTFDAIEGYWKAAEQGDADAQDALGVCYYYGRGIEKDFQRAFELFEKAAEQGNISSQFHLGLCYYCGEGVERNTRKAVRWFERAAKQGHAFAQNNLGPCY